MYFYSEGLFSVREGGQLLTDDRIISYQVDAENNLQLYEMRYDEVERIELIEKGSYFADSVYKIHGNENSQWSYIVIVLTVESDGDKMFIEELESRMK